MKTSTALKTVAVVAVAVPLGYVAYRLVKGVDALAGAGVAVARAPSSAANAVVRAATGDANQTLGGAIFDFLHPELDKPGPRGVLGTLRDWAFGAGDRDEPSTQQAGTAIGDGLEPITVTAQRLPQPGSLSGQAIYRTGGGF